MQQGHIVTTIGLVIYSGIGFAGSVVFGIGQWMSFQALESAGAPDAAALADGVAVMLIAKVIALSAAVLGGVLIGVGIFYLEDRRRLVWWGLLVGSIPLLAIFPLGTIIAAFALTYLFANKNAFLKN